MRSKPSKLRRAGVGALSLFIFFALWDVLALVVNNPYLPRPLNVLGTLAAILLYNQQDFSGFHISQHIIASLSRVFFGFLIASALAIPVGLLTGWLWYVESTTSPIIEMIRPVPPFAWIPFAIFFLKDPYSSIFIVFLGAFFPVLLNVIHAVKTLDRLLVDAAKTLGANREKLFGKIVLPASVPSMVTGMRIGLGIGWMCVVAAELVGVKGGGLGFYILIMSEVGRFVNVFAGMSLIGIIGFLMVAALTLLERRISYWAGMR